MFHRKKLLILIPTLLLIPLLVGMIPLKLVNKLAQGGPYAQCQDKQGCGHKNCSAHSLISQNHLDGVTDHSTSPDQDLSYLQKALPVGSESFYSHIGFTSIPLRC
ncbi:MAG: hypothetical protein A3J94_05735 [Syntrophus sp. RIFOXYC2_FULL_54_9]|nr:MAG: hypothetical protein A3J94_05735 [Syntrophus sp. RIFOXYC2_FULL_54_9]HBB16774.1 hypothetical protein [Syntrophus sp. (in: bacteria)]